MAYQFAEISSTLCVNGKADPREVHCFGQPSRARATETLRREMPEMSLDSAEMGCEQSGNNNETIQMNFSSATESEIIKFNFTLVHFSSKTCG